MKRKKLIKILNNIKQRNATVNFYTWNEKTDHIQHYVVKSISEGELLPEINIRLERLTGGRHE